MEKNIFRSLIHLEMMFLGSPYFVTMLEMQVLDFSKLVISLLNFFWLMSRCASTQEKNKFLHNN